MTTLDILIQEEDTTTLDILIQEEDTTMETIPINQVQETMLNKATNTMGIITETRKIILDQTRPRKRPNPTKAIPITLKLKNLKDLVTRIRTIRTIPDTLIRTIPDTLIRTIQDIHIRTIQDIHIRIIQGTTIDACLKEAKR
jgi:hypothetical protein